MLLSQSLHERIYQWLGIKLASAEASAEKWLHEYNRSKNDHTHGQYKYFKSQVQVIKWLMSQIPKRYHDIVTFANDDLSEVEAFIIQNAKDVF